MAEERTQIDAEKFALHFLDSLNMNDVPEHGAIATKAKEALAAYLSAYYLAEQFNHTEDQFFSDLKDGKIKSNFQEILSQLNQY
ncbi:hypothetical protein ACNAN0_12015 [Agrilactobacillus fermenti]|uniref:hypothetical protein n=1 Tax=Agrilactobacillus fermenti TaxID=2586909 RepID=UPI003A5C5694